MHGKEHGQGLFYLFEGLGFMAWVWGWGLQLFSLSGGHVILTLNPEEVQHYEDSGLRTERPSLGVFRNCGFARFYIQRPGASAWEFRALNLRSILAACVISNVLPLQPL